MYCSIQRRTNGTARLRWLARSVLAGGLSAFAVACSGDVDSDAEPEDESRSLEGMPPAMTNMGSDGRGDDSASDDTDEDDGALNEGAPNATGLDGSGNAEENDPADGSDGEVDDEQMSIVPVESLDVPAGAYCEAVADWDPEWVQFEEEVLLLVNEFRSEPADCGVEGQFAAAGPLTMDPILRCSARLHSADMFTNDYFAHDNEDGLDPFERMDLAGFQGGGGGENIALGQQTPEEVMQAWMDSDGHCANVMRGAFTTIGIGYHPGAGQRGLGSNYWTQNFGAPAPMRGGGRAR
jgi:uncharacterized protein YkwD